MRRLGVAALMTALLLLAACGGGGGEERLEGLRARLAAAGRLTMTAEVTAYRDEGEDAYTLGLTREAGETVVEVLAPELIAGVRARVSAAGAQLAYENVLLDLGELAGTALTPVGALPYLAEALATGHADSFWTQGADTVVKLVPDDDAWVELWLDEAGAPRRAALYDAEAGRLLLACEITAFALE